MGKTLAILTVIIRPRTIPETHARISASPCDAPNVDYVANPSATLTVLLQLDTDESMQLGTVCMASMRNRPPAISLAQRYSARGWDPSTWREPCCRRRHRPPSPPTSSLKDIEIALPDEDSPRGRCCCCSVGLGRAVSSPLSTVHHHHHHHLHLPVTATVRITPRSLAIALQMHHHCLF